MTYMSGAVFFLFINAAFHQSACERFNLIRATQAGGLNPPAPLSGREQLVTIFAYALTSLAGFTTIIIGFEGYNFLVWLPAILCWVCGFVAFSNISNPLLKKELVSFSSILVPFLFWIMLIQPR
ncbi:hypothetical protein PSTH1771_17895 [Pseudomonas syringae pv. theae]|uniref:hypothetical protein n=2 Tax=Pseudomonas TaxID=286 RepID=UPI0011C3BFC4|nr:MULTISPECIES: hypothetical protein [Pseudomonas syringae group]GKS06917.1 hypothetical protein PSTH1771_17895 [Pseudomonas syringae pv. theae]